MALFQESYKLVDGKEYKKISKPSKWWILDKETQATRKQDFHFILVIVLLCITNIKIIGKKLYENQTILFKPLRSMFL